MSFHKLMITQIYTLLILNFNFNTAKIDYTTIGENLNLFISFLKEAMPTKKLQKAEFNNLMTLLKNVT